MNRYSVFLAAGLSLLSLHAPANPLPGAMANSVTLKQGESGTSELSVPAQTEGVTRCWQYGRMVFESRGYTPVASPGTRLIARGSRADGPSLYVTDLQSGYCLMEVSAR